MVEGIAAGAPKPQRQRQSAPFSALCSPGREKAGEGQSNPRAGPWLPVLPADGKGWQSLSRQGLSPQLSLLLHRVSQPRVLGSCGPQPSLCSSSPFPAWGDSVQALCVESRRPCRGSSHLWLSPGQPGCSQRLQRALSHGNELHGWEMRQGPGRGAKRVWHGHSRALLLDDFPGTR